MQSDQSKFIARHTSERLLPTTRSAAVAFPLLYGLLAFWRAQGSMASILFGVLLTTILSVYLNKQFWRCLLAREFSHNGSWNYAKFAHGEAAAGTFVVIYLLALFAFIYAFTQWV